MHSPFSFLGMLCSWNQTLVLKTVWTPTMEWITLSFWLLTVSSALYTLSLALRWNAKSYTSSLASDHNFIVKPLALPGANVYLYLQHIEPPGKNLSWRQSLGWRKGRKLICIVPSVSLFCWSKSPCTLSCIILPVWQLIWVPDPMYYGLAFLQVHKYWRNHKLQMCMTSWPSCMAITQEDDLEFSEWQIGWPQTDTQKESSAVVAVVEKTAKVPGENLRRYITFVCNIHMA